MPPSLSREFLSNAAKLEASEYQSFLNYSSSRVRACSMELLRGMSMMESSLLKAFKTAVAQELAAGACIAGYGVLKWHQRLRLPAALQVLTPLAVEDRLESWEELHTALLFEAQGEDRVLRRYEGNWWSVELRTNTAIADSDALKQGVDDIWRFWQQQLPTLPTRGRDWVNDFPFDTILSVNRLTTKELYEAVKVAEDSAKLLDKEIAKSLTMLTRVKQSIRRVSLLRETLRAMEADAIKREAADDIAAHGKAAEGQV